MDINLVLYAYIYFLIVNKTIKKVFLMILNTELNNLKLKKKKKS
jgi:hypothetical protein